MVDVAERGRRERCAAKDRDCESEWVRGVEVVCEQGVGEEGADEGGQEVAEEGDYGEDSERVRARDIAVA